MDAVDEVAIDFHIFGAQLRPQAQARITRSQIVDGNREAHVPVVVQRIGQQLKVVGRGMFGQLDHHPAGWQADLFEQFQGLPGGVVQLQQRFRRDVEKQLALQLLFAETPAGAFPAGSLQFGQAAGLAGDGKQVQRCVQRAVGRPAAQRLMAENPLLAQAHDRLEQTVDAALSQDGTQGTELFGDGHGVFLKMKGPGDSAPGPSISRQRDDCLMTSKANLPSLPQSYFLATLVLALR
ncbi:hypothetical protein O164_02995 [Pseudomonas taiwanensis SJ9]|uniref:Uncharacterized protein n=1 Tax=Pseudomonas taiwanensis SJ9 TaxID=1388762 RepID=V7DHD8_9PSED|nr:hypothetical protein O164_02995 [Pseudomonas taiwanensis SJ9]